MTTCLNCGNKLSGRSDKKFCNYSCKNDFHNNTQLKGSEAEKSVGAALRRNRKILKNLFEEGFFQLDKDQLENFGFNFKGLTGIELNNQKVLKYFCYEFSISPKGNSLVLSRIK